MLLKANEYQKEMDRVKTAIEKSDSAHLKRDLSKYLKRLERESREYKKWLEGGRREHA